MRTTTLALGLFVVMTIASHAVRAEDCPNNPDALGTSRVLTIDPNEFPKLGAMAHAVALPLAEREVVLTFGAVARVVGIEGGVVSEVINLESSGVRAPDRRPRHDQHYHEDRFLAA